MCAALCAHVLFQQWSHLCRRWPWMAVEQLVAVPGRSGDVWVATLNPTALLSVLVSELLREDKEGSALAVAGIIQNV